MAKGKEPNGDVYVYWISGNELKSALCPAKVTDKMIYTFWRHNEASEKMFTSSPDRVFSRFGWRDQQNINYKDHITLTARIFIEPPTDEEIAEFVLKYVESMERRVRIAEGDLTHANNNLAQALELQKKVLEHN